MNTPALLLFDLGGVLVENRTFQRLKCLAPEAVDSDTLKDRWLHSPTVRRFELGQSTAAEFAAAFIAEWGLSISADAFLVELGMEIYYVESGCQYKGRSFFGERGSILRYPGWAPAASQWK